MGVASPVRAAVRGCGVEREDAAHATGLLWGGMKRAMRRIPRDVSVQLFRREGDSLRFLMLKRTVPRGGFWQGVERAAIPFGYVVAAHVERQCKSAVR